MAKSKHGTILVVDDDDQLVGMLQIMLESNGYRCLSAYGGCQAMSLLAREPVDLVLTDLSMTWGDGLSLLEWIRRSSKVPVVVISGHVREFAAKVHAFENVTILSKPIDTAELFKCIRRQCRPQAAGAPPQEGRSMQGRSVVIADDDPGIVRLLGTVLEPLGLEIRAAPDAFTALVRIRETPPDLAILDINMPAGNGLSVCEMLATDPALPRLPVIILTGDANVAARQRCCAMGAHFVTKGAEAMKEVVALVKDILEVPHTKSAKSQFFIG